MALAAEDIDFLVRHREDIARLASSGQVGLHRKSEVQDATVLRQHFGERGRAVHELLRARATGKIPDWWLADSDSAQQATPAAVAAYRAQELRAAGVERVIDTTCSIGTEGAAVVRAGLDYFGFDRDPARVRMARHNVPAGHFAVADALRPPHRGATQPGEAASREVILADPARRAGGRRITKPEELQPPLPDLIAAYPGRDMVVKCAPGLDYSFWDGGVTVFSQHIAGHSARSGVKEVCLYSPGLQTGRRAVILTHDEDGVEPSAHVVEEWRGELPEPGEPGRFIIDPDGAIVRAGLVRDFAAREGLWQLDERIAYLTGDRLPRGTSGFPFIEAVSVKKVKQALQRVDAGSAEILVRGLDIDPDAFRKKLKLKGSKARAVVLTRIGKAGVGLICDRRVWDYDEPEDLLTQH